MFSVITNIMKRSV